MLHSCLPACTICTPIYIKWEAIWTHEFRNENSVVLRNDERRDYFGSRKCVHVSPTYITVYIYVCTSSFASAQVLDVFVRSNVAFGTHYKLCKSDSIAFVAKVLEPVRQLGLT